MGVGGREGGNLRFAGHASPLRRSSRDSRLCASASDLSFPPWSGAYQEEVPCDHAGIFRQHFDCLINVIEIRGALRLHHAQLARQRERVGFVVQQVGPESPVLCGAMRGINFVWKILVRVGPIVLREVPTCAGGAPCGVEALPLAVVRF